jgi:hypothetical protein
VAKRLLRILGKEAGDRHTFELRRLTYDKVGLSRKGDQDFGQLKRSLDRGLEELERAGYLVPMRRGGTIRPPRRRCVGRPALPGRAGFPDACGVGAGGRAILSGALAPGRPPRRAGRQPREAEELVAAYPDGRILERVAMVEEGQGGAPVQAGARRLGCRSPGGPCSASRLP